MEPPVDLFREARILQTEERVAPSNTTTTQLPDWPELHDVVKHKKMSVLESER